MTEVKWDPDNKITFDTGAIRSSKEGKGRYDLLPWDAMRRVALIFEIGGKQKGDRNWEKGFPIWSLFDSTVRHLGQYMQGLADEDHLALALWNLLCLVATDDRITSGRCSPDWVAEMIKSLPQELFERYEPYSEDTKHLTYIEQVKGE